MPVFGYEKYSLGVLCLRGARQQGGERRQAVVPGLPEGKGEGRVA